MFQSLLWPAWGPSRVWGSRRVVHDLPRVAKTFQRHPRLRQASTDLHGPLVTLQRFPRAFRRPRAFQDLPGSSKGAQGVFKRLPIVTAPLARAPHAHLRAARARVCAARSCARRPPDRLGARSPPTRPARARRSPAPPARPLVCARPPARASAARARARARPTRPPARARASPPGQPQRTSRASVGC